MPKEHEEILRLSTSCEIVPVGECEGLRDDYVFAGYEGCGGRLSIEGPVDWVLPILRLVNTI